MALSMIVEIVVAVLLLITLTISLILNRRLGNLRANQDEMRRLIVDPELRRRLGAAGERNVRRFEKAAIVAQWDALIREAIAAGTRGPALGVPDLAPAALRPPPRAARDTR